MLFIHDDDDKSSAVLLLRRRRRVSNHISNTNQQQQQQQDTPILGMWGLFVMGMDDGPRSKDYREAWVTPKGDDSCIRFLRRSSSTDTNNRSNSIRSTTNKNIRSRRWSV